MKRLVPSAIQREASFCNSVDSLVQKVRMMGRGVSLFSKVQPDAGPKVFVGGLNPMTTTDSLRT